MHENRHRVQVIDRNVEESLQLMLMEIDAEHSIRSGRGDHVRHELCANRNAWLVLSVLARVAIVRHDAGDTRRRSAASGVDEQQKLEDVLGRWIRRLNDEDIEAPNVLVDAHRNLAIGELAEADLAKIDAKMLRDRLRESAVGRAGEQLEAVTRNS